MTDGEIGEQFRYIIFHRDSRGLVRPFVFIRFRIRRLRLRINFQSSAVAAAAAAVTGPQRLKNVIATRGKVLRKRRRHTSAPIFGTGEVIKYERKRERETLTRKTRTEYQFGPATSMFYLLEREKKIDG